MIPSPIRNLTESFDWLTTSSVLISHLPSNNSSLKSVLVLFCHHTINTQSRNICSCQTSPQSDLSRLAPGCSPKPHSSDGLHLPIRGNHLQPNKSSKETLTARWCLSLSQRRCTTRPGNHHEKHIKRPVFLLNPAELSLQYLCFRYKAQKDELKSFVVKNKKIVADRRFKLFPSESVRYRKHTTPSRDGRTAAGL